MHGINFIPDICIYHNVAPNFACPDGLASAYVVWRKFRDINPDLKFIGMTYEEVLEVDLFCKNVLVVDFSFPLETLENLRREAQNFLVIDHHKSFADLLKKKSYSFDNLIFDQNECGASLTWKTLFPGEPVPIWLDYIKDNDLFNLELPDSESFNYGCAKLRRSFDLFEMLHEESVSGNWFFMMEILKEKAAPSIEKHRITIDKILSSKKKFEMWGSIPVLRLTKSDASLKSRVANVACKKYLAPFTVLFINGDSRVRVKTANKDIDLLEVFEAFNPTGHTGTCGFELGERSEESFREFVLTVAKDYF